MSMTKEETTYTVFYEHAGSYSSSVFDAESVDDALEHFSHGYGRHRPVAWSTEQTMSHGGNRLTGVVRAESIAAGRVIDLVDGRYVARGVPVEDKPAESMAAILAQFDAEVACARAQFAVKSMTPPFSVRVGATEKKRPALDWNKRTPFDAFKGFFAEPADMADWQDTYYPR